MVFNTGKALRRPACFSVGLTQAAVGSGGAGGKAAGIGGGNGSVGGGGVSRDKCVITFWI
jgi:hypothetical protein